MEQPLLRTMLESAYPAATIAAMVIVGYAIDLWGRQVRDRNPSPETAVRPIAVADHPIARPIRLNPIRLNEVRGKARWN